MARIEIKDIKVEGIDESIYYDFKGGQLVAHYWNMNLTNDWIYNEDIDENKLSDEYSCETRLQSLLNVENNKY